MREREIMLEILNYTPTMEDSESFLKIKDLILQSNVPTETKEELSFFLAFWYQIASNEGQTDRDLTIEEHYHKTDQES